MTITLVFDLFKLFLFILNILKQSYNISIRKAIFRELSEWALLLVVFTSCWIWCIFFSERM